MRVTGNDKTITSGGISVDTPYEDKDKGVKVEDFLQLMIAQLSNQDFMNPVDDTQYVTQLAQFATMQSMQELSHYSQNNYVMSLVGKNVTAASLGIGGQVNKETGVVSRVNITADGYTIVINGKEFSLSQLMSINDQDGDQINELDKAKNMDLQVREKGSNSIKIGWKAPADLDGLTYDVYYTTDPTVDFNDPEAVKKSGKQVEKGISGNEANLTDLDPDKVYYINVIVRSKDGKESIYRKETVRTDAIDK